MLTRHLTSELQYVLAIFARRSVEIPAPATRKSLRSSKSDFHFQIALAPLRGAKFWQHLGQPILRNRPFLGADATKLLKTQHFAQFLPAKNLHISHISAV